MRGSCGFFAALACAFTLLWSLWMLVIYVRCCHWRVRFLEIYVQCARAVLCGSWAVLARAVFCGLCAVLARASRKCGHVAGAGLFYIVITKT